MNYKDYELNDFVTDESFIRWVKNPNGSNSYFWNNWIKENPDKKEIIDEAFHIVLFLHSKVDSPQEEDEAFNEVKSRLFQQIKSDQKNVTPQVVPSEGPEFSSHKKTVPPRFGIRISASYKIAASITGLLILVSFYFFIFSNQITEHKTAYAEQKEVILADGSTVFLNANSSLKVATAIDKNEIREVWLDGEAFFNVTKKQLNAKDEHVKFIVHANSLHVEVIGTSFNVNTRRGTTEVVLKTGKVKLHSNLHSEKIEMIPGELVEYKELENEFNKKQVEPEVYASWRKNKLIFDNHSLEEIFKVMEDQYGFETTFSDGEIAQLRFTGTTPLDKPEVLLTSIANSFNLNITKQENIITINKK